MRTIVIRDSAVVAGTKHPEDDHHADCQAVLETGKNHNTITNNNKAKPCKINTAKIGWNH